MNTISSFEFEFLSICDNALNHILQIVLNERALKISPRLNFPLFDLGISVSLTFACDFQYFSNVNVFQAVLIKIIIKNK